MCHVWYMKISSLQTLYQPWKNEAWLLPLRKSRINTEIDSPRLCALQERDAQRHWTNAERGSHPPLLTSSSPGGPVHKVRDACPQKLHSEAPRGGRPGSKEADAQVGMAPGRLLGFLLGLSGRALFRCLAWG